MRSGSSLECNPADPLYILWLALCGLFSKNEPVPIFPSESFTVLAVPLVVSLGLFCMVQVRVTSSFCCYFKYQSTLVIFITIIFKWEAFSWASNLLKNLEKGEGQQEVSLTQREAGCVWRELAFTSGRLLKVGSCGQVSPLHQRCPPQPASSIVLLRGWHMYVSTLSSGVT